MNGRFWVFLAGVFGLLAVAAGAMGAHTLETRLDARAMSHWQTASFYMMVHALALLGLGAWSLSLGAPKRVISLAAGLAFCAGIVLFSGSLYALALTGDRSWGHVTPFGGLAFMLGWIAIGWGAIFRPISE